MKPLSFLKMQPSLALASFSSQNQPFLGVLQKTRICPHGFSTFCASAGAFLEATGREDN